MKRSLWGKAGDPGLWRSNQPGAQRGLQGRVPEPDRRAQQGGQDSRERGAGRCSAVKKGADWRTGLRSQKQGHKWVMGTRTFQKREFSWSPEPLFGFKS